MRDRTYLIIEAICRSMRSDLRTVLRSNSAGCEALRRIAGNAKPGTILHERRSFYYSNDLMLTAMVLDINPKAQTSYRITHNHTHSPTWRVSRMGLYDGDLDEVQHYRRFEDIPPEISGPLAVLMIAEADTVKGIGTRLAGSVEDTFYLFAGEEV